MRVRRPERLAVVRDEPGSRLTLAPAATPVWRRSWRRLRGLFAPGRAGAGATRYLLSVDCDSERGQVEISYLRDGNHRRVSLATGEILGMRVRTAESTGGGLVVSWTVETARSGANSVEFVFRVVALDRQDEVIDLAFALARCCGMSGYRLRSDAPADVDVAPAVDSAGDPYRTVGALAPLPAAGEPLDLVSSGRVEFSEPERTVPPFEPEQAAAGDTVISTWEPGRAALLRERGEASSGVMTAAWKLLVALIVWPIIAAVSWTTAVFVTELAVGLVFLLVHGVTKLFWDDFGSVLFQWYLYVVLVAAVIAGLVCLAITAPRLARWAWSGLRWAPGLSRLLDWNSRQLVVRRGRRSVRVIPFEDVCTVHALRRGAAATVWVEVIGEADIRLAGWTGGEGAAVARSLATDLARALNVPVVLE